MDINSVRGGKCRAALCFCDETVVFMNTCLTEEVLEEVLLSLCLSMA